MADTENKLNNNETNDFDLEPEISKAIKGSSSIKRKVALSTILTQIKDCKNLLEQAKVLHNFSIINSFDSLKMWVNLAEHGERINFQLQNMEETIFPTLPPNPHRANLEELSNFIASKKLAEALKHFKSETKISTNDRSIIDAIFDNWEDDNEDSEFELTENDVNSEIVTSNISSHLYPDCRISYDAYINNVGIVSIYIKNDILVIWVTGKIMSDVGNLGLITRDNIRDCLNRVLNLHLFSFNIDEFIEVAGCYIVDNTVDLLFDSELQTSRMINAISSFLPLMSKTYYPRKYKRNGLLISKRASNTGYSLAIYCKGEELRHSIKHQNRATLYTDRIGIVGEDIARRTLRLELHMKKFEAMREFLNIPKRERELVLLSDVLNSTATPILNILYDLGIDEEKLIQFLTWYEPIAQKDEKQEPLSDEEFIELIVAERFAELLKDNDFNTAITKAHIVSEYNIADDSKLLKNTIPIIKTNLYKFLCFRKAKSVKAVLNLLSMVYAFYGRNAEGNNE